MTQDTISIHTADGAIDVLAIETHARQLRANAARNFFASLFATFKTRSQRSGEAQSA